MCEVNCNVLAFQTLDCRQRDRRSIMHVLAIQELQYQTNLSVALRTSALARRFQKSDRMILEYIHLGGALVDGRHPACDSWNICPGTENCGAR